MNGGGGWNCFIGGVIVALAVGEDSTRWRCGDVDTNGRGATCVLEDVLGVLRWAKAALLWRTLDCIGYLHWHLEGDGTGRRQSLVAQEAADCQWHANSYRNSSVELEAVRSLERRALFSSSGTWSSGSC